MKVLAIAVHPDDETLGCGGTLLKLANGGATLHWVLLTAALPPEYSTEQMEQQCRQVERVRSAYPFTSLDWLKFPTTHLGAVGMGELVRALHNVIRALRPEIVFIPNRSDVHSDHQIAFQAVQAVLKAFYMRSLGVRQVLACDVMSETDAAAPLPESIFLPTVFVDITDTLERKLEIMSLFESELHAEPLPRSLSAIRAQARVRGATIGAQYAEAFMLIRELW